MILLLLYRLFFLKLFLSWLWLVHMSSSFDSFMCIKYDGHSSLFFSYLFIFLSQIICSTDTILYMYKLCILFPSIFFSNSSVILCCGILFSLSLSLSHTHTPCTITDLSIVPLYIFIVSIMSIILILFVFS